MRRIFIAVLLALAFTTPATAADVLSFYAAAQGAWFDGNANPSDLELGGTGAASLSPHISLAGSALFGTGHSYLRGTIGPRFTVSDADNPNFSIGVGVLYQGSSEPSIRPEGWHAEASIGVRPWPEQLPRGILIGQAAYKLSSEGGEPGRASLYLGGRYQIGGQP